MFYLQCLLAIERCGRGSRGEAEVITITALVVAMVQVLFVKKDLARSLLEDGPGEFYSLLRMYFEGAHCRKFESNEHHPFGGYLRDPFNRQACADRR